MAYNKDFYNSPEFDKLLEEAKNDTSPIVRLDTPQAMEQLHKDLGLDKKES